MLLSTRPSSGVLDLVGGTAATSYAVAIWIDVFSTLTIHSKTEVRVVPLFMRSMCCICMCKIVLVFSLCVEYCDVTY
jgi:hypothetical protein